MDSQTIPCPRCRRPIDLGLITSAPDYRCPNCSRQFETVRFEVAVPNVVVVEMSDGHTDAAQPCSTHPRNAAVTSCQRCGAFMCALCRIDVDGKTLCPSCFERLSTEGSLESSRTTFRDYAGLSSVSATGGCLIWFIGFILGPLAIYFGIKGLKQKKQMGERDGVVGIWVAMTLGVVEVVASVFLIGALLANLFK